MIIVGYKEASANFDTVASAAGTPRTPAARSATARRKRSKASALSGGSLKSFAHLKRGEAWGFHDRCGGSRWSMFKPERRPPPPGQYEAFSGIGQPDGDRPRSSAWGFGGPAYSALGSMDGYEGGFAECATRHAFLDSKVHAGKPGPGEHKLIPTVASPGNPTFSSKFPAAPSPIFKPRDRPQDIIQQSTQLHARRGGRHGVGPLYVFDATDEWVSPSGGAHNIVPTDWKAIPRHVSRDGGFQKDPRFVVRDHKFPGPGTYTLKFKEKTGDKVVSGKTLGGRTSNHSNLRIDVLRFKDPTAGEAGPGQRVGQGAMGAQADSERPTSVAQNYAVAPRYTSKRTRGYGEKGNPQVPRLAEADVEAVKRRPYGGGSKLVPPEAHVTTVVMTANEAKEWAH